MNQAIIASVPMAPMQMPVVRRRRVKVAEPEIKLPPRGSRGPVHIYEYTTKSTPCQGDFYIQTALSAENLHLYIENTLSSCYTNL